MPNSRELIPEREFPVALVALIQRWLSRETNSSRVALVLCRWNTLLIVLETLGLSTTGKMTDADKVVNPEQTSESRVIRKSGLNSHITFG